MVVDIRQDAHGGESGREREDAQGDGFGDHDCRDFQSCVYAPTKNDA